MSDRVSASITIGSALPSALLPDFIALIEQQCLSTEWDGEAFTASDLAGNAALNLMAHEVAWRRFEELEVFCVKNAIPLSRWSGAYRTAGRRTGRLFWQRRAQILCHRRDDYILIGRRTTERLGSFAAIVAHFAAADLVVPPLVIG